MASADNCQYCHCTATIVIGAPALVGSSAPAFLCLIVNIIFVLCTGCKTYQQSCSTGSGLLKFEMAASEMAASGCTAAMPHARRVHGRLRLIRAANLVYKVKPVGFPFQYSAIDPEPNRPKPGQPRYTTKQSRANPQQFFLLQKIILQEQARKLGGKIHTYNK